jgi:hypothetical protein
LSVTALSPIATVFTVSAGGRASTVAMVPGKTTSIDVPTKGVRAFRSYACLLSVRSSEAFVPHLREPGSNDMRNLGFQIQFTAFAR